MLKYIKIFVFSIVGMFIIYLFLSLVLSRIPVNKHSNTDNGETQIFILSNGVHLDILLPAVTEYKNWMDVLEIDERIAERVQYIGFGWGDKGFYLNTPEWSDLTIGTACRAVFLKSDAAMHITPYSRFFDELNAKAVNVSVEQFKMLTDFISASFKTDQEQVVCINGFSYNGRDSFYEATGAYSMFFTCNSWSNKALKQAGLPACVWTPFDKGVLRQYQD